MKKSLSLLLAIALVFTMAASAFAADTAATGDASATATSATYTTQEKYDQLVAAGIFEGDADGLPHLDAKMTRAQFAKILTKVFGLKENVDASKVYGDLDGAGWAAGFIGAVTAAKYMEGDAGKFMPSADVTTEQLATVLVRTMGLKPVAGAKVAGTSDWAAGYVQAALDAKLIPAAADYTKAALRGALVEAGYAAYVEVTKPTPTPTVKPTPTPTPAANAVTSVTAVSTKKVEVAFESALTAAEAVYSNFSIKQGTTDLAVNSASLSADSKVVTLNTAPQTTAAAYTLTISNLNLKNASDATKTFIGAIADTAAPSAITAVGASNTSVTVTFTDTSSKLDKASAENVANYTIAGLTVTAASLSGKVVTLTTSAQTAGNVYTVSVVGVKDIADNAIVTALTATFAGKLPDTAAPSAVTVSPYSNTQLIATFTDASNIDQATAETASNYTIAGLTVNSATLISTDDAVATYGGTKSKSVLLNTSAQSTGTVYTLSVLGVKDISGNAVTTAITTTFAGKAADTAAPSGITVAPFSNTQIVVTFTDSSTIDKATAETATNYTIAGLTVTSAQLITTVANRDLYAGTINKSVIVTTSAQATGTVYTVSVTGVKDIAGNAITSAVTNTFAGKAVDATAPTITSVTGLAGNQVKVVFNEAGGLDAASVQTLTNYSISTLGYPLSVASYDAATRTVILNTAPQSTSVYTITVNNVKDIAGNTIAANTAKTFAGVGDAQSPLAISSVTALNNRQIQLVFNKDAANVNTGGTDFTLRKGTTDTTFETIAAATAVKKIDAKTYILTINTTAANFLTNDVYTLIIDNNSITDLAGTAIDSTNASRAQKVFGGLDVAPTALAITNIQHTAARQVVLGFNQKVVVTGYTAGDATIVYGTGPTTINAATAVVDSADATKVNLTFASKIAGDQVASIRIAAANVGKITDITGNIPLAINDTTNNRYAINLGTVDYTDNGVLKLSSATAIDEQTVELAFNQDVTFNGGGDLAAPVDNSFVVFTKDSDNSAVTYDIKYAAKSASNKVRIYFTGGANFSEGTIYRAQIQNGADGDDLFVATVTGVALEVAGTASADGKAVFGYNATVNDAPYLVGATALTANKVQLTFSESLNAAPVVGTDLDFLNAAGTSISGDVTIAEAPGFTNKTTYIATLANGQFLAASTYRINVKNGSALTDKQTVDVIKQASTTDANLNGVTFGGLGALVDPVVANLGFNNAATKQVIIATADISSNYKTLEVYVAPSASAPTASTVAEYTLTLSGGGNTIGAHNLTGAGTVADGDTVYYRLVDTAGQKTGWVADGDIDVITGVSLTFDTAGVQDAVTANTVAGLRAGTYTLTTAGGSNTVFDATVVVTGASANAVANFGGSIAGVAADNGNVTVYVTDANGNRSAVLAAASVTVN